MSTDYAPETLRAAARKRLQELRRIRYERAKFRLLLAVLIVTVIACFWWVNR